MNSDLKRLCENLSRWRRDAARRGGQDEQRSLLDALRRLDDPAAPDPAREEIAGLLEHFWRSRGLTDDARSPLPETRLPGQRPAPPPEGEYRCPLELCGRHQRRMPGGLVPMCDVFRKPLEFEPGP